MSLSNSVKQATALKYQRDKENSAPVVIASGMGVVAQKIVDVASENNIPIFEDDSLATLLSQLNVGQEIPDELFQAVVDIYVYFLNYNLQEKNQNNINVNTKTNQNVINSNNSDDEDEFTPF